MLSESGHASFQARLEQLKELQHFWLADKSVTIVETVTLSSAHEQEIDEQSTLTPCSTATEVNRSTHVSTELRQS